MYRTLCIRMTANMAKWNSLDTVASVFATSSAKEPSAGNPFPMTEIIHDPGNTHPRSPLLTISFPQPFRTLNLYHVQHPRITARASYPWNCHISPPTNLLFRPEMARRKVMKRGMEIAVHSEEVRIKPESHSKRSSVMLAQ